MQPSQVFKLLDKDKFPIHPNMKAVCKMLKKYRNEQQTNRLGLQVRRRAIALEETKEKQKSVAKD